MPTPWDTDNTDEGYAPHMYIQNQFVGNNPAAITVAGIEYRVGVVGGSQHQVICESINQKTFEKTPLVVKNFSPEIRTKLLEYLGSDSSINVSPEDQEYIREAFGFPKELLEESLRGKVEKQKRLNKFIITASDGRESVVTLKQRRRVK